MKLIYDCGYLHLICCLAVMADASWSIDSSKLPQRLDFEVSDHAYDRLQRLSAKAGLSARELAEHLIAQCARSRHDCG